MKVTDIMTRGVISLAPTDSVHKAAERMLRYDVSGFPVLDQGKLVGMITQGDFLRRAETGTEGRRPPWTEYFADPGSLAGDYVYTHARTVADVMTRDVVTIAEDASLDDAVGLMQRHHVKRLPVVKGDAMVGIVSRVNLLHAFPAGTPKDAPAPLDDSAICDRLTAKLKNEPWLPRGSVQAIVKDGVVVLQGTVSDQRQRTALRVAAENIPGVKQVIDELREIDLVVVR